MSTSRPVVSIYKSDNPAEKNGTLPMPHVLCTGLRPDIVRSVHRDMSKNRRQAHGVKPKAGYDYAATSWGTGRAVARIPRVPGSGTHAAGQGAYGNQCRGGGMFAPLKTLRRWHRRVNVTQKRHAVVTALAASSLPPLVMARGHRIGAVSELPLVVSDGAEAVSKTKDAVALLKSLGCTEELQRIYDSRKVRKGVAKLRIGRYRNAKGPLVIYNEDNGIVKAMRNIPGVETANVDRLNLLTLAPGGNFGRFIIWTEGAFKKINQMYGRSRAPGKTGYSLPREVMANADVARIINSDEIQSVVRPKLEAPRRWGRKLNALRNRNVLEELNPGAADVRASRKRQAEKGSAENTEIQKAKQARVKAGKAYNKTAKKGDNTFYKNLMTAFETKAKAAEDEE